MYDALVSSIIERSSQVQPFKYYTVIFGISRVLPCFTQLVLDIDVLKFTAHLTFNVSSLGPSRIW